MKSLELKVPPVAVFSANFSLMWLVSLMTPDLKFCFPGRILAAGFIVVAGSMAAIWGIAAFLRAKTTVNPLNPNAASSLVVGGVYKITRNPMYLGLLSLLIGWALFLANPLTLVLIVAFVFYMNRFQIIPEERSLEAQFGGKFQAYKASVRRWL